MSESILVTLHCAHCNLQIPCTYDKGMAQRSIDDAFHRTTNYLRRANKSGQLRYLCVECAIGYDNEVDRDKKRLALMDKLTSPKEQGDPDHED